MGTQYDKQFQSLLQALTLEEKLIVLAALEQHLSERETAPSPVL